MQQDGTVPFEEQQRNALNYQFSAEELQVLRECNRESFFQRSLPLGTAFGFATWYAVQNKYLKASARFGAGPKVLIGVTLGYFIGKVSYQSKCAEKIMRLPNSRLAEIIRQRRLGGSMTEKLLPDQGFGATTMLTPFVTTPDERHADEAFTHNGSLNLDTDMPHYAGLDDSGRPTVDSSYSLDEDLQLPLTPKVSKSYEEMRRQNRDEYLKRQQQPYQPPTLLEDAPPIRREVERPRATTEEQPRQQPQAKNKYGDSWSQ